MDQPNPPSSVFSKNFSKPDLDLFISLSNHIFFPRNLPSSSTKTPKFEAFFLHLFHEQTQDFLSYLKELSFSPPLDIISIMLENWIFLQGSYTLNPLRLHQKIHELLNTKNYLPVYIMGENACLLLKFQEKSAISCSSFSISLPPETILSHIGDLKFQIPQNSCFLPDDNLIKSMAFSETVVDISQAQRSKNSDLVNQ